MTRRQASIKRLGDRETSRLRFCISAPPMSSAGISFFQDATTIDSRVSLRFAQCPQALPGCFPRLSLRVEGRGLFPVLLGLAVVFKLLGEYVPSPQVGLGIVGPEPDGLGVVVD